MNNPSGNYQHWKPFDKEGSQIRVLFVESGETEFASYDGDYWKRLESEEPTTCELQALTPSEREECESAFATTGGTYGYFKNVNRKLLASN
tara:strand:+ start:149 stop:421 length:273 start_codon:yes stop_codon:yes gene_type:complete